MKTLIQLTIIGILLFFVCKDAGSQPLPDYTFKSPSFNGNGYSSHILTIENQEHTRREAAKKEIQAALDKVKSDASNTNLQKFFIHNFN